MSLSEFAAQLPDKAAYIAAETGETLTFRELNEQSIRLGRHLRRKLEIGERFSILLENSAGYCVGAWAGRRSGLRYVPVNWHLNFDEASYIVENSDSRALISSPQLKDLASAVAERSQSLEILLSDGDAFGKFRALSEAWADESAVPMDPEVEGYVMFYSSGTTGKPKGVLKELPDTPFGTNNRIENNMVRLFQFDDMARFFTPAPLYHGAPCAWTMGAQQLGGTAVIPKRFDAEETLRYIEEYRITHAQFVPTHFIRMLKLPEGVRKKYDLSSLRMVSHSAAPCPVEVKERIIDWFGPIVHEYYGQSEATGMTAIGPLDWLEHKGSVGRAAIGTVHIIDDEGNELPAGEIGHIMFEGAGSFEYHKEPEKTAEAFNEEGWARPGDMGWLSPEGYLYLTDRASHMIISGGVNIYPQEIEAVLTLHPFIRDVAVIGVPDSEFGEQVKAVIETADGVACSDETAEQLLAFCRENLAGYKCPKSVDFVDDLPRLPSGKLLKRELRKRYWPEGRTL